MPILRAEDLPRIDFRQIFQLAPETIGRDTTKDAAKLQNLQQPTNKTPTPRDGNCLQKQQHSVESVGPAF